MNLRPYLAATGAILERDWRVFVSYRFRWVSQLFQTITSLTLFYYVSRLVTLHGLTSHEYFANVTVGLVVLGMLTSTIGTVPPSIRQELVAGTFEQMLCSPFGPVRAVLAMMLFPFLSAAVFGMLTIVLAVTLFGLSLHATAVLALPVAALASLAFGPFVLLAAAAVLVLKQASVGASFAVTFISIVGGFFFPVALLPGWLRWFTDVQPFTPALALMRHLIVGTALPESFALTIGKIVFFTVLLLPLACVVLQRAIDHSRKRGTIIEY